MNNENQAACTGGFSINGKPTAPDGIFNDLAMLEKRSTEASNAEGEFSVFQINRAAEAAIIVAAQYLKEANIDAFQKDSGGHVARVLARASKMFTI